MKTLFILLAAFSFTFMSCEKEELPEPVNPVEEVDDFERGDNWCGSTIPTDHGE